MKFSKKEIEAIERLKKPEQAQPLGLVKEHRRDDYELLKKVGIGNCLYFSQGSVWKAPLGWKDIDTFIIKPDFHPEPEEPEIVRAPIVKKDGRYGCCYAGYRFIPLGEIVSYPDFVCFKNEIGEKLKIENVASQMREGTPVFAEFVERE